MSIQIITDTGSDMIPGMNEDVVVIPMKINFDGKEYKDGVDISHKQFYEMMEGSDVFPTTSQISPYAYEEVIEEALKTHDQVLIITLSSGMSGTYQSACIAANSFDGKVAVVDSLSASLGIRVLIDRAVELTKTDMSLEEIVDELNEFKNKVHIVALLHSFEYLKKGGRIPASVALAGNALNIKPVITAIDGKVSFLGAARGSKKGNNLLVQQIEKSGGIDFSMPFYLGYTGKSDGILMQYINDHKYLWENEVSELPIATMGCTMGSHAGPGTIAIAFVEKQS